MTASVWSGHWAPLAITSHMWDTEEAEPWDTAQLLQEPARVTGAALPGCVRLSPVSGEWDERPPAQRDGCGARRGQAGHHPMSPGPLVVTLHSPVTRPLSPAWPRRLLLSWAGLHHPELPGDTHWWHPGTGDIATLTRATNERRWRGHGGVTWCLSDTRCQLPGVNWAQCGRHTQGMTSEADSHNMLQKRHKDTEQIISIYTSELCLGKRFVIRDGCHEGRKASQEMMGMLL